MNKQEAKDKLLAGVPFRNSQYPDNGNRYKVKKNNLGQLFIIQVGDWFDVNDRTGTHHISEIRGGKIYIEFFVLPGVGVIHLDSLIFFEE